MRRSRRCWAFRVRFPLLSLPILAVLAGAPAQAQVDHPFVATLKLKMTPSPSVPAPLTFTISGSGVAPVTTNGGFAFPASGVSGLDQVTGVTFATPPSLPLKSFFFGTPLSKARNFSGFLGPGGGPAYGFGGGMPQNGKGRIVISLGALVPGCTMATGAVPLSGLGLPTTVVVTGPLRCTPYSAGLEVMGTGAGSGWTTGAVGICTDDAYNYCAPNTYSMQGYAYGMGYDARVGGVGNIQLVTPVLLRGKLGSAVLASQVGVAELTISFGAKVPTLSEGAFLGLAAAMASIGALMLALRRRRAGA